MLPLLSNVREIVPVLPMSESQITGLLSRFEISAATLWEQSYRGLALRGIELSTICGEW